VPPRGVQGWERAGAFTAGSGTQRRTEPLAGSLSLADLAFVSTVVRLHAHAPDLRRWRRTAWMATLLARDRVRAWMDEARTLPPVRLDDYLAT